MNRVSGATRTVPAQQRHGKESGHTPSKANRILMWVLRALGLWAGFTVFFSSVSVCPFCGQQGCVVGLGTTALFGAVFSFFMMRSRTWAGKVWKRLFRRKR